MLLLLAVALVVAAAVLTARGWDVRLVLLIAAGVLGVAANCLPDVSTKFFATFCDETYLLPIGTAMGFAYVLRHTGADLQMARVLVAPVRRVRFLIVPGVVLAGFIVNVPVLSQTSVAVCLGAVVVPVMRAAGFHPLVIGSALLLGSSVGGELFNPGAPELNTVFKLTGESTVTLARKHLPWVVVPQLVVSTLAFWALTRWWWKDAAADPTAAEPPAGDRIKWWQAAVPLVPLFLLVAAGDPLNWIQIPTHWMVEAKAGMTADDVRKLASGRTVGLAMMAGSLVAAAAAPRQAGGCVKAFFEGAGYALTNIVSLIVAAVTFGKAMEKAGFGDFVGQVVATAPWLLAPLAVLVPGAFAAASGSGMASTSSLYPSFHQPAIDAGANPNDVGALVSIGSAAGRTMSPVAAVAVMCGRLTDTTPWALAGRVAVPLLAGLVVVIALRMCGVV